MDWARHFVEGFVAIKKYSQVRTGGNTRYLTGYQTHDRTQNSG